jgi:hypothetical protein
VAIPTAGLPDLAKIAHLLLLLWQLLLRPVLQLSLLRILRHNRLCCWLYHLLRWHWGRDLRRWRIQCDVTIRRLAQASVVDTDLSKVIGGLRVMGTHLDDNRGAGNGDTLSRVETAKHYWVNPSNLSPSYVEAINQRPQITVSVWFQFVADRLEKEICFLVKKQACLSRR